MNSSAKTSLQQFLESGIIEFYCLGLATPSEITLVEDMASKHPAVLDEIEAIHHALAAYSRDNSISLPASLREKILHSAAAAQPASRKIEFPPRLAEGSTIEQWQEYMDKNQLTEPEGVDFAYILPLPGNSILETYIVWAKKDAHLEESHDNEEESLLMISGSCEVMIGGVTAVYKTGDFIRIPKQTVHAFRVLSDSMIAIGQRIAA